jgi:hypothetical protein
MAAFTPLGVQAVVKGLPAFTSGLNKMDKSTLKASKSVDKLGESSVKAGSQLDKSIRQPSQNMIRVTDALKGAVLGLVASFGVREIIRFGKELVTVASQAERLGRGTENLAQGIGSSGDAMVAAIQEASGFTIDRISAMQAANKAMLFGIVESSDEMQRMTEIAVTLGAAMGQDAAKSLDDLTTALGRQSPLILDNLGITLKLEDAYKIYAEQLGVTVTEMSDVQKQQAFLNAALIKGEERVEQLGGVVEDTAAQSEKLGAALKDLTITMGQGLTPAAGEAGGALAKFIRDVERGIKIQRNLTEEIVKGVDTYEEFEIQLAISDGELDALTRTEFEAMKATLDLAEAQEKAVRTWVSSTEARCRPGIYPAISRPTDGAFT